MNRMIAAASAAVLSLTVAAGAAVAQDFRALAQQDLQAAHDALAANHPAAVISRRAQRSLPQLDRRGAWPRRKPRWVRSTAATATPI